MKFGEQLTRDSGVCGLDEEELKLFHYNPEKNVLVGFVLECCYKISNENDKTDNDTVLILFYDKAVIRKYYGYLKTLTNAEVKVENIKGINRVIGYDKYFENGLKEFTITLDSPKGLILKEEELLWRK